MSHIGARWGQPWHAIGVYVHQGVDRRFEGEGKHLASINAANEDLPATVGASLKRWLLSGAIVRGLDGIGAQESRQSIVFEHKTVGHLKPSRRPRCASHAASRPYTSPPVR